MAVRTSATAAKGKRYLKPPLDMFSVVIETKYILEDATADPVRKLKGNIIPRRGDFRGCDIMLAHL